MVTYFTLSKLKATFYNYIIMIRFHLVTLVIVLYASTALGQTLRSHVITSTGNSFMTDEGATYISVGEPMSTEITNGDIMISQGFLQVTVLSSTVATDNEIPFDISIYPNPVTQLLMVELEEFSEVRYQLIDQMGRQLQTQPIYESTTEIDMTSYSEGIYYLQLVTETRQSKLVKIQKSNL